MTNFVTTSPQEFNESIKMLESTDACSNVVFNELIQKLVSNDVFLKKLTDAIASKIDDHSNDISSLTSSINSHDTAITQLTNRLDSTKSPYDWLNYYGYKKVFTVNGDANTYYPVQIEVNCDQNEFPAFLGLGKRLGTKTPSTWSGNHSNGTSSMMFGWLYRSRGWDGNGTWCKTLYAKDMYATKLANIQVMEQAAAGLVLYLRGGGAEYTIMSNCYIYSLDIYYSATNIGDTDYPCNVTPLTSYAGNKGIINTSSV